MTTNLNKAGRQPTRTARTIERYRRTYLQLVQRAAQNIQDDIDRLTATITWFSIQNGWSRSTVRQYRASLLQALTDLDSRLHLDPILFRNLYIKISEFTNTENKATTKRTSARKRKTCNSDEVSKIIAHYSKMRSAFGEIMMGMITCLALFGLRPSELASARIETSELIVINGKYSNGRAFGPQRRLDLSDFGSKAIDNLRSFFDRLRDFVRSAGGWERFYRRASKSLTRTCEALNIKKICFYTLRHQFSATAKSKFSKVEVAALMGHASDQTAGRHYARRRSGWKIKVAAKPSRPDVLAVRAVQSTFDREQGAKIKRTIRP